MLDGTFHVLDWLAIRLYDISNVANMIEATSSSSICLRISGIEQSRGLGSGWYFRPFHTALGLSVGIAQKDSSVVPGSGPLGGQNELLKLALLTRQEPGLSGLKHD